MDTCPACHNILEACDCFTDEVDLSPFKSFDSGHAVRPYGRNEKPKMDVKKHDTTGYTKGCRCWQCREAKRVYQSEYLKRSK